MTPVTLAMATLPGHRAARPHPQAAAPYGRNTMRLCTALVPALALGTALASAATTASATAGTAPAPAVGAPGICAEKDLDLRAAPGGQQNVVRLDVTNHGPRACVVDRLPTITFRGLDGSAQPSPPAESAPYTLARGARAYAAARTAVPGTTEGHVVAGLSVAADPSHVGVTFPARAVGMPGGVHVWEPVTTWWHDSRAAADRALADAPA
ncbi:DUF4232 domain-containing protein [Streptomyces sp. NPDC056061]|uniref:DUF4232 domain-containing protein n=1 Tax=Streptomyces sp. NPDC056061 TaxID=3345700 RepID=UPI0035E14D5D